MVVFLSLTLGLSFLLAGMKIMRRGLECFAGGKFEKALSWMTATPWRGMWSGTVASALMQSSTALTVMTVSLVDAGLLPFANSLGIILGGNIGTTVTAQLIALPLGSLSIYILLLGTLGFLFQSTHYRYLALSLSGLGLLFLGLTLLHAGLAPISSQPEVQDFLHQLGDNHLQGVLAGTLIAALIHSSGATTGIAMLLANNGWITLPTALAFVFGANLGTCATAVLASFAAKRAAQKVALFHVLLNLLGILLFYPFLDLLAGLVAHLGSTTSRQVANAHTLFNLVCSFLAFPFIPYLVRLFTRHSR